MPAKQSPLLMCLLLDSAQVQHGLLSMISYEYEAHGGASAHYVMVMNISIRCWTTRDSKNPTRSRTEVSADAQILNIVRCLISIILYFLGDVECISINGTVQEGQ